MILKIYNSKTNQKEVFEPLNNNCIKMYVCGPTVYNEIHIGNARSAIVFDVLFRILKFLYPKVIYTRNITDIDDKIINKAKEEKKTCEEIASFWAESYFQNCEKLNLLKPTFQPKATETIAEMIGFIGNLIEQGFAYEKNGDVFFDVSELEEYGSLSHNTKDLMNGYRVTSNESKDDQQDFILWKQSQEVYEPYWNSPWGKGRPGWHIECSAMSYKFLGEKFDIHAGGSDLLFPHHENEQAQNFGCHGEGSGPKYWMHNAMLALGKEKMSKSVGNIILLSDLLKQYNPIFLKFYILNTHYRHLLTWNEDNLKILAAKFNLWIMHLGLYFKEANMTLINEDFGELLNDLNTPGFFVDFERRLNNAINKKDKEEFKKLAGLLTLLGLNLTIQDPDEEVINLAQKRYNNKQQNNFNEADLLRLRIEKKGFYILDTNDGYDIKPKFCSIL